MPYPLCVPTPTKKWRDKNIGQFLKHKCDQLKNTFKLDQNYHICHFCDNYHNNNFILSLSVSESEGSRDVALEDSDTDKELEEIMEETEKHPKKRQEGNTEET
eukprot:15170576-Ditylum_brightwellii.AAC.1